MIIITLDEASDDVLGIDESITDPILQCLGQYLTILVNERNELNTENYFYVILRKRI